MCCWYDIFLLACIISFLVISLFLIMLTCKIYMYMYVFTVKLELEGSKIKFKDVWTLFVDNNLNLNATVGLRHTTSVHQMMTY